MRRWQRIAGALILIGLGAYALASGQFQAGYESIKKAVETIGLIDKDAASSELFMPNGSENYTKAVGEPGEIATIIGWRIVAPIETLNLWRKYRWGFATAMGIRFPYTVCVEDATQPSNDVHPKVCQTYNTPDDIPIHDVPCDLGPKSKIKECWLVKWEATDK